MRPTLYAIAAILLLAAPAFAGDGIVEIGKTCAVAGCFAGDGPNLPITIDGSAGRSYMLTSDLTQTDPNVTVLSVTAPDVTIDLHGFSIRGSNQCSGSGGGCSITGTGHGLEISADRVQVANGSVVGAGSVGIFAGDVDGLVIRNVRVAHNRFQGISIAGAASIVENATAQRNGDVGISVGRGGRVTDSSAIDNGLHGIQGSAGVILERISVVSNGLDGVFIEDGGTVSQCLAEGNGRYGVLFGAFGSGKGSVSGCAIFRNLNAGVSVRNSVLVAENSIDDNQGAGIVGPAAYRANLISGNDGGIIVGIPVNLGNNACYSDEGAPVACP